MPDTYTYTQVRRVSPKGGTIAGGTAVTIAGFGFNFATGSVTFGGVEATDIVIVSNTEITAVTPEHASGAVDVVVAGVGTGSALYTYQNLSTTLLPRVPVTEDWKLDVYGAPKWLMEVKRRLEQGVVIEAGSVVGGAPLTRVNDTNVTLTLGGTPESALLKAVSITVGWTGALTSSRGGTGIQSYVTGDLLYASSAVVLSRLASVSAGSYLRSAGVATAPVWSTLKLPNAATTGDLPYASATDTVSMLADVSVGSYLRSGGVATAPLWSTVKIPNTAATGDLLYGSASNVISLRTIGSTGDVLTVSGGLPVWAPTSGLGTGDLTRVDDTNVTLTLGGTPVGSLFKSVSLTMGWTGTLGVTRGGTGTGTTFTTGSVIFAGASGVYTQDNTNFFWDDSNNRLGIGTNAPSFSLDILGATAQLTNTVTPEFRINLGVGTTSFATLGFYEGSSQFAVIQYLGSAFATAVRRTDLQLSGGRIVIVPTRTLMDADATVASTRSLKIGKNTNTFTGIELNANSTTWFLDHRGSVDATNNRFMLGTDATNNIFVALRAGQCGIGTGSPTAKLHLPAGTITASTAPLKFTSGSLLSSAEVGAIEFLTDDYYATITTGAARKGIVLNDGTTLTATRVPFATTNGRLTDDSDMTFATDTLTVTKLSAPTSVSTGTLAQTGKTTTYNNIATAGWGVPAIYGSGRSTAQTAAVASVAAYTVGAADGSFLVDADVNVTTSTTHNFTVAVDYTDETNAAQTLTLTFSSAGGVLLTAITNATGAGPYHGVPLHIRCKASTAITIKTTGTFTTVTYNVEGTIRQVA